MSARRLSLIRHLKAGWSDGNSDDFNRPLTPEGMLGAAGLKQWIETRVSRFDLVLCSPAQRTVQTKNLLGLNGPPSEVAELYLAKATTLLEVLHRTETAISIALIAHNPGIATLASDLLETAPTHPRFNEFPPGSTIIIDFPEGEFAAKQGQLVDFTVPDDLLTDSI